MLVGHFPSPKLTDETQKRYFSMAAWKVISPQGKEILGQMLRRDVTKRPTAAAALKHTWVQTALETRGETPAPLILNLPLAIRAYAASPGLRKLALAVAAREVN